MNHAEARLKHKEELLRAHNLGEQGKYDEAEKIYLRYIEEYPFDAQVLFNLGVLVQRRADNPAEREEAGRFYQRCVESPDCETFIKSNAMNNLGLIMGKINETDKAGICFGMALKINPGNNAARINFADILRHNGDYETADREFAEVLKLDPDSAPAKFSAGMIALLLGDMKRGFELYESRFDVDSFPTKRYISKKPLWDVIPIKVTSGGYTTTHFTLPDLNGKTILITSEQGLGDDLMFIRYASELKKRWPDCRVWFGGGPLMANIFKGVDGLDFFTPIKPSEQLYDYHCPSMSLPHRFGTTPETIPNEPYISPVAGWKKWEFEPDYDIDAFGDGELIEKKIGICFAGSPRHGKDAFRSLAPEAFQSMIDAHAGRHQFYSLQVGPKADEAERLKNVIDLAPTITDFTDTAQAILQLDLIVTVDTALGHLCGALGKPCFVLLPKSPDWRWMLTREDTPWYPKHKLFRQENVGDWAPVLKRISEEL